MKRIFIAIIGGTVIVIGLFLIVLPGPAFIVIPAGLAILATEFFWAKRCLDKGRDVITRWKTARANGTPLRKSLRQCFSRMRKARADRSHRPADNPANQASREHNQFS
jgi:hypothetical protein